MEGGHTRFIRETKFHKAMHLLKQSIWSGWQLIPALWYNICLYACNKTSFLTSSYYSKVHLPQKLSALSGSKNQ